MTSALDDQSLDQIFRLARTFNGWADCPIEDKTVREIYDLMKWGPTSANSSPARFVWVRSADGKATLAGLAAEPNKPKILKAPVTVIIGHDLDFAGELPKLLPHSTEAMQKFFAAPGVTEVTAMRNGTLQGAYLIVAARALGLDCGPMSGFDNAGVDKAFFPARESSRTLSAALATAIQLPYFRAILALALRRPVAGPNHVVDRTRSEEWRSL
jgi:3-hydroxypropanoate dehydrogenase